MKPANTLRVYYFIHFMNIAALFPFLNLYLRSIGLSGTQIGIITSVGLLMMTISQPIWGLISDVLGTRKRILQLNLSLSLVFGIMITLKEDFFSLLIVLALFYLVRSPLMRIVDTIALTQNDEGDTYGRVRLWGSLGFALAVVLVGNILRHTSLKNFSYIFAVLVAFSLLVSFHRPSEAKRTRQRGLVKRNLISLIRNRAFLLFLIFSFLVGLSAAIHSAFFSIYFAQIGAGEGLIGVSWGIAALSEVAVFFYSQRLLRKFSSVKLLSFGALLYGIRWILYAVLSNPLLILLVQATQGISFALFYFSGITFVSQVAPSELQVTGQGIFGAVFTFGLSGIVGSLLGGLIFDVLGVSVMYGIAGLISILAAFLFSWGMKTAPDFGVILRQ